ncbi:MAG: bifunctional (p)ppGpp synthetase/guanosine-3',5'-bis(diphosphate) 3'-pyrophosphohydrolase [Myxococcales bacterium]|nr:bifunctional (p)ppGpp synthetase/guanosine-3',5'-bis(diphosphate) 3'-pyrophosphohydrolase [Myxococcales bacterium]
MKTRRQRSSRLGAGERKIFEALDFATRAHRGQYRKGTRVPYLLHPLRVARLLIEAESAWQVVVAGLLHDTTEDAGVRLETIRRRFGSRVARLVSEASEPDKTLSWEERKRRTLAAVATASPDALRVELADKLDNIRSIREDLEKDGDALWARFRRGREEQRWYYRGLAREFSLSARAEPLRSLARLFAKEVRAVFSARREPPRRRLAR